MKRRWRWCRRLPEADPAEARRALEDAREEQKRIQDREPYIQSLEEKLVKHNEDNHFSEWVLESMRRRGHT